MKRTQKELESRAEETMRLFDRHSEPTTRLSWKDVEDRLNNESQMRNRSAFVWIIGISLMIFLNLGSILTYYNSFAIDTHKQNIDLLAVEYNLNQDISIFYQD